MGTRSQSKRRLATIKVDLPDSSWELLQQLHFTLNYHQVQEDGPLLTISQVLAAIADDFLAQHAGLIQERAERVRCRLVTSYAARVVPPSFVADLATCLGLSVEGLVGDKGARFTAAAARAVHGAGTGSSGSISGIPGEPGRVRPRSGSAANGPCNAQEETGGTVPLGTPPARPGNSSNGAEFAEAIERQVAEFRIKDPEPYRPRRRFRGR